MKRALAAVALCLSATPGWGAGRVVEESRNVGEFTGVHVGAGIHAKIVEGGFGPIGVRGEEDALRKLRLEIKDGTLVINYEKNSDLELDTPTTVAIRMPRARTLGASGGSKVEASVPAGDELSLHASGGAELHLTRAVRTRELEVHVSGAARLNVAGVETGEAEMHLSGAAQLALGGRAESLELQISGAAQLDAARFEVRSVEVTGSGGAMAAIRAGRATGSLSGGAHVRVPAGAETSINGSGGARVTRDL